MEKDWDKKYTEFWNERYQESAFSYGRKPNVFFKEWLQKYEPSKILMPADGEGRNGVYAAEIGWDVTSFDLSTEGKIKAQQLAIEKNVPLEYKVGDFEQLNFENETYDAIGLIYAHFSAQKKTLLHKKLDAILKPGGIIVFEAFSEKQLGLKSGGPKDIAMLYSKAEIETDFNNYEILHLEEELIILDEGQYHQGKGYVIRFVGRKKG